MTDVVDTPPVAPAEETKPAPAPVVAHPCYCGTFELVGKLESGDLNEDEIFTTGCQLTTKSTFGQGHDAKLVSFLVDGHFDGYVIRQIHNGVSQLFQTPADAAKTASEALHNKAVRATENRQAKVAEKDNKAAERQAAKDAKAKEKAEAAAKKAQEKAAAAEAKKNTPHVEVVAGSAEGDGAPLAEGQTKIKVGRWEYNAVIDDEGNATYIDGSGAEQIRPREAYQLFTEV